MFWRVFTSDGTIRPRLSRGQPDLVALAFTGDAALPRDVEFEFPDGILADYLRTSVGVPLVSARFREALARSKANGWSSVGTRNVGREGVEDHGLLVVRGRCAAWGMEVGPCLCGLTHASSRPHPDFPMTLEWHAPLSSWDGSDLFIASGTTALVVTDEIASALRVSDVTGMKLVPIAPRSAGPGSPTG